MLIDHFFYCSKEYVESIDQGLFSEINNVIRNLPKRNVQAEINKDLFWSLTQNNWAYDSMPQAFPKDESIDDIDKAITQKDNKRYLCSTSTTLNASWHSDFAKLCPLGLVQIEAQLAR